MYLFHVNQTCNLIYHLFFILQFKKIHLWNPKFPGNHSTQIQILSLDYVTEPFWGLIFTLSLSHFKFKWFQVRNIIYHRNGPGPGLYIYLYLVNDFVHKRSQALKLLFVKMSTIYRCWVLLHLFNVHEGITCVWGFKNSSLRWEMNTLHTSLPNSLIFFFLLQVETFHNGLKVLSPFLKHCFLPRNWGHSPHLAFVFLNPPSSFIGKWGSFLSNAICFGDASRITAPS